MKKVLLLTSLLFSIQSEAAIVGVSGQGEIITPITVQEDSPTNTQQQGFNENQGVLLGSNLDVDGPTDIAAGILVDSHLIFYNTPTNDNGQSPTTSAVAKWTFSGDILGVISQRNGGDFADSNAILGDPNNFTVGLTDPFNALGLENNGNGLGPIDGYSIINGNELQLAMQVSEPGDWIRVVTAAEVSAVPLPASAFLFGPAVLGFIARRRIKK